MKRHLIFSALAATILLGGAAPSAMSAAAEQQAEGTQASGQAATATVLKSTKPATKSQAKRKPVAIPKPIDINSASREELKKLPGINDAEVDRIIAGRPYGSKTWLVSDKIIPEGLFLGIRSRIEARQPHFKNAAEIKAYYAKKNPG